MKIELKWSDKMLFFAHAGQHQVPTDARPPIGANQGMTPKELLLSALGSCTAMDVAALLKKHRQPLESLEVHVDAPLSEGGHPKTFLRADIVYRVEGNVDASVLLEAVRASETKFCGVSAMLSRAFPIEYVVVLNGETIGDGKADFAQSS